MKNKVFIVALLLCMSHVAKASYQLVWEDNFNSFNTTAWEYEVGNGGWGNGESQYYTNRNENVSVSNGNLQITARKENYGGSAYTSGRIRSYNKVSMRYGKIEARIKCPWGAIGVWPAFWMMGQKIANPGWPRCGEIDIMEQMCTGDPNSWNTTLATYHWDGNGGTNSVNDHSMYGLTCNVGEQLGNQYRIYGVEWTPSQLKGYVCDGNGNNYRQIVVMDIPNDASRGLDAFHQADNEFYMILNIALGGSYTGYAIDGGFSSATMYVDWIRIYQDYAAYSGSKITNRSNLTTGGGTGDGGEQTVTETVAFKNAATTLEQSKSYSFNVNYTVAEQRDLWVALYRTSNYDLIGESKIVVNKGSGTANLTINLNNVPDAGNDYILLTDIRPLNGAWTTRIKQEEKRNVTINQSCKTTNKGVATFYVDADYSGNAVSLEEGTYTKSQMAEYCINDNSISSIKVLPGYKVTTFIDDNFNGTSKSWTGNVSNTGGTWNDVISSIKIEAKGVTGKSGTYKIKGRNSAMYWDLKGNGTGAGTMLVQYNDEGDEKYQRFTLVEISNGVYNIKANTSDLVLDIKNASVDNRADVQTWTANGSKCQQYILVEADNGYYQFVARHCGKVIEVPDNSSVADKELKLWDNNSQKCSHWLLESPSHETYDYWVIYRDDVSDMSSYLDLRNNGFAEWEGTVSATKASMYESNNALAYNINAAKDSWFGLGVLNTTGTYYFADIANYGLHFAYKTNYNGELSVKLGGTNGEYAVAFTPNYDNKWHTKELKLSDFTSKGLALGSCTNNLLFSIVSEKTTKTGAEINIDDIYYYKKSVLPIVFTETESNKTDNISCYQISSDIIRINGISEGTIIDIIDLNGINKIRVLAESETQYIYVSNLVNGLYIVRINDTVLKIIINN